jgi:hypothetical protein
VSVPIGLLVIYLARTMLQETQKERMKLDATGAVLATLACTAAVFGFSMAPEKGWLSATTIGSGVVALAAFVAFVVVERTAENPIVPFDLFFDRNRLAIFVARSLFGGAMLTLMLLVGVYVQAIMGYSALRAGVGFIPFAIAMAIGVGASSRLVMWFSPRVVVIAGAFLMLGATKYGSTLHRGVPYFPNLVLPLVVGAIGMGLINVPLGLSLIASVDFHRIGPASAIALMLQILGGPLVLDRHPGRDHVAHAAAGRHQGAGKVHERRSVACTGSRLHLRPSVVGRGGHPARRGGAAHQLHLAADCARETSQESHRGRGSVAGHKISGRKPAARVHRAGDSGARLPR